MPQPGDRYAWPFTVEPGTVLGHFAGSTGASHTLLCDTLVDGALVLAQW
jgi:hypothetical protein